MKHPGRQRALREIARDLADSDPCLDALFLCFNEQVSGEKMPQVEKVRSLPRLLACIGRQVCPTPTDFYGMLAWRV
jgi:hypothetical protein